MKALVLGCGLVGSLIAEDLSKDSRVTVIDINPEALKALKARAELETVTGSVLDADLVARHAQSADIVIGAVPGKFGYEVLNLLIGLGKNVCDISFMPEDFMALDAKAKEMGVTVAADFGVAPGMSHLLVGRGAHLMDRVEEANIFVGGIPADPKPPFNFKIVFSPEDVLQEYTRPARFIENGKVRELPALSRLEQVEMEGVGRLEAFLTDGLRTLLSTVEADSIIEKTMRWPGHAEMMAAMRELGMFDESPRVLGGTEVIPLKVTSDLLFPAWEMKPQEGDRDITVMRVCVSGSKGGEKVTHTWGLLDRFDESTDRHSMARATGFPAAILARAIASGLVKQKGVLPPENLAADDALFDYLIGEQKSRGVVYRHQEVTG